jgi:hypothetical protein
LDCGEADSDDESDGTFWTTMRFMVAVLQPIYTLMRKTDSAAPMMGKLYKLMSELGGELDDVFAASPWDQEPWSEYKQDISDAHQSRWTYLHCDYHAAGYALDPNFLSDDVNGVNGGEVFAGLSRVIERTFHDDEAAREEAFSQYSDFRKQRGVFVHPTLRSSIKTMGAHEWWEMAAGGAAELRKVAMRVLSKTTSASACERNWSAFAAVQTPKRNRLHHSTLTDLVSVRINLRLQQRKNDTKFKDKVAEWVKCAEQNTASDVEDAEADEAEDEAVDEQL